MKREIACIRRDRFRDRKREKQTDRQTEIGRGYLR